MANESKKLWFPAKRYSWGWGFPNCWQGWMVLGVWLALLIAAHVLLLQHHTARIVTILVLAALLIVVCLIKGEKPRWRWGKD